MGSRECIKSQCTRTFSGGKCSVLLGVFCHVIDQIYCSSFEGNFSYLTNAKIIIFCLNFTAKRGSFENRTVRRMFTTYNGTPDPNMGITKPLLLPLMELKIKNVFIPSFVFANNHVLQNFPFPNEMLRHTIFHSCLHNIFQNRSMCISLHKVHPKYSTFLRRFCTSLWNISTMEHF